VIAATVALTSFAAGSPQARSVFNRVSLSINVMGFAEMSSISRAAICDTSQRRGRSRLRFLDVRRLAAVTGIVSLNLIMAGAAFGQTNWTGLTSNGWFNPGNWSNGVPTTGATTIIDTASPNPTEVRGTGAVAGSLFIGSVPGANGVLTVTTPGTLTDTAANIGNVAGSFGTVIVTGAGATWTNSSGVNVGNSGTGTLTVANGGVVRGQVVIANNAGSIGALNIGAGGGSPAVAPGTINTASVAFGAGTGTLNFNHTSSNYVFAPAISGPGTVNVLAGTTIFTANNTYSGTTDVAGGTLAAGRVNVFSPNSAYNVMSGGTLNLEGNNQNLNVPIPALRTIFTNAGTVQLPASPGISAPGTTLTVNNYVGVNGNLVLNTFLGADNSPSDKLVISGLGGNATGTTTLTVHNVSGPGAETSGNGILVVNAVDRGVTAPGTFVLQGELRAGAFDYDLFRGGLNGSDPTVASSWFLRSTFSPDGPGPVEPIGPNPPPAVLPPGFWPIIGPELATDGVVQPIARQMGLQTLGTLHQRIGDTLTVANTGGEGAGIARSDWARFFGQGINNRYQAFADPQASGWMGGFQGGVDLLRTSLLPGHRDVAGVYLAFANSNVNVNGLVTNPAATAYVQTHTGTLGLNSYSAGGYWTHYGPNGWYLDAVLQETYYNGNAITQFANLPINGSGFISSLEGGYPIPLPLGPRFVLEPQAQIIWQQVAFNQANDGLGPVGLGTTSGTTGRVGLRGVWTIDGYNGHVWQPYVRTNIWRDWGAEATTTFGIDQVPLIEEATRLEFAGGVTALLGRGISLYAQAGYQFALDNVYLRNGVQGDIGLRYVW
jgi:outer membrane autotransporter protein